MIVCCAFFMQQLDATIIATALPQIAFSFGDHPVHLNIAITAYILSLAVFIPISGWLADRFGSCTVFRAAIGAFAVGSLLCGLSNSVVELTAARVVQGMGGAMMAPVGRLLVLRSAKKTEFISAMALLQVPAQIGAALGPLLGGLFTTYASWRWIFWINVPICIAGITAASIFIENHREPERKPLDWIGFVLTGISLASLLYGLETLAHDGSLGLLDSAALILGLVIGGGAVIHSMRHAHPLLDPSLLRVPTFKANMVPGTLFRLGIDAAPFLLPLLFQVVFGMSAFLSGILTFATALGSLSMKTIAQPIIRRVGFRNLLIWNTALCAAIMFSYVFISIETPAPLIFLLLLLGGFFQSLQFSSLNAISYADIEPARMSSATSFSQLGQRIVTGFSVAMVSLILQLTMTLRGATDLATVDFQIVFMTTGLISLSSIALFWGLAPDAGREVSGHRPR